MATQEVAKDSRLGRYEWARQPDHPRAKNGRVLKHILVAEAALGSHLPLTAQVHHIDGNGKNNHPSNLVVCEDQSYHMLLHRRMRGLEALGNPNALPCNVCGEFDLPENLRVFFHKWKGRPTPRVRAYHLKCKREQSARTTQSHSAMRLGASTS